jgi:hypothetical protein
MNGLAGVPNADEFLEPALRPVTPVRIAAFDGENADPANARGFRNFANFRTRILFFCGKLDLRPANA